MSSLVRGTPFRLLLRPWDSWQKFNIFTYKKNVHSFYNSEELKICVARRCSSSLKYWRKFSSGYITEILPLENLRNNYLTESILAMVGTALGSDTVEEIPSSGSCISVMLGTDTWTLRMWSSQRGTEVHPHQNWEGLKAEAGQSQPRMEKTYVFKQDMWLTTDAV